MPAGRCRSASRGRPGGRRRASKGSPKEASHGRAITRTDRVEAAVSRAAHGVGPRGPQEEDVPVLLTGHGPGHGPRGAGDGAPYDADADGGDRSAGRRGAGHRRGRGLLPRGALGRRGPDAPPDEPRRAPGPLSADAVAASKPPARARSLVADRSTCTSRRTNARVARLASAAAFM